MFFLIGLGLGDEKDITVRGLETIKRCDVVYLEYYTSLFAMVRVAASADPHGAESGLLEHEEHFRAAIDHMSRFYGKSVVLADRHMIEHAGNVSQGGLDLVSAMRSDVALLVVGDPLSATTHTDLLLRCSERKVPYQVLHNTSIMTAIGIVGPSLYQFGITISIPFFQENWQPTSFYHKLAFSLAHGQHTLCLLDIKVKEPTEEELARGRERFLHFDPPRFMTVHQAIRQLLQCEQLEGGGVLNENTFAVGVARLGLPDATIVAGTFKYLLEVDFGPPLHALILPATTHLHDTERAMLRKYLPHDCPDTL